MAKIYNKIGHLIKSWIVTLTFLSLVSVYLSLYNKLHLSTKLMCQSDIVTENNITLKEDDLKMKVKTYQADTAKVTEKQNISENFGNSIKPVPLEFTTSKIDKTEILNFVSTNNYTETEKLQPSMKSVNLKYGIMDNKGSIRRNHSKMKLFNFQDNTNVFPNKDKIIEKFGPEWRSAGKVWENANIKWKATFSNMTSDLMKDLLDFDYTNWYHFYPLNCDFIYNLTSSKREIARSTNKKVYIVNYNGPNIRVYHINSLFGNISYNDSLVIKKLNNKRSRHFMYKQRQKILAMKEILLYARLRSNDLARLYGFCIVTKSGRFHSLETVKNLLYKLITKPYRKDVIEIHTVSEYLEHNLEYNIKTRRDQLNGPKLFFNMVDMHNRFLHSKLGVIKNYDEKLANYRLKSLKGKQEVKIIDFEALNTGGNCKYKYHCSIQPLSRIAPDLLPNTPNCKRFIADISKQFYTSMEIKYTIPDQDVRRMIWSLKPVVRQEEP
ncbi:unnamed protein product [Owenia fusiformis]|uniref:Uncharacterized protein n=1 Tax=Owenia fusiformis TaxID=6347 RepID=A0A8J1TYD2_OWEFU|nr:unnamed protein product [Owenia fusiformis]